MNFLRNYVRFAKSETDVIFEQAYDQLTNYTESMGIEAQLLDLSEKKDQQKGLKQGEKKGLQKGIEQGRHEKDVLVIQNLIAGSTFSDEQIASFVGVEVSVVTQIRTEVP